MGKKPRYILVKEEIERSIRDKELLPGDKLASEPMLAQIYNVSRSTLREAIKMLQKEGVLISKNGVGTYVNNRPDFIVHPLSKLQSLGEMIKNEGYTESESDVNIYNRKPEKEWQEKLQIPDLEEVTVLERTRTADSHKVAFYYNIFPHQRAEDLLHEGFSGAIFDLLLKKAGIKVAYAITEIYAVDPCNEMDQKAIDVLGNGIILLKQLHFDEADEPVFYSLDYLKTSFFKLSIKRN